MCALCVAMRDMTDRALAAEMVLRDAVEAGRIMSKYLKPEIVHPDPIAACCYDLACGCDDIENQEDGEADE